MIIIHSNRRSLFCLWGTEDSELNDWRGFGAGADTADTADTAVI
jgi:hypothetical protein